MTYVISEYFKDPNNLTEEEQESFKKIIYYIVISEKENLNLDFSGVLSIDEEVFSQIFFEICDNPKALRKIKIYNANIGVTRSLKRVINPIKRTIVEPAFVKNKTPKIVA